MQRKLFNRGPFALLVIAFAVPLFGKAETAFYLREDMSVYFVSGSSWSSIEPQVIDATKFYSEMGMVLIARCKKGWFSVVNIKSNSTRIEVRGGSQMDTAGGGSCGHTNESRAKRAAWNSCLSKASCSRLFNEQKIDYPSLPPSRADIIFTTAFDSGESERSEESHEFYLEGSNGRDERSYLFYDYVSVNSNDADKNKLRFRSNSYESPVERYLSQ